MSCITLRTSFGLLGFYMLDKCPDDEECYVQGSTPQPVSSACTKRIYINEECARCNGNLSASDFIPWQMVVRFNPFDEFISLMNTHSPYRAGYTVPSAHRSWIMHYGCGKGYTDTCQQSKYSNKDTREACDLVHAPVFMESHGRVGLFRNVYCMSCGYGRDLRSNACPDFDDPFDRRLSLNMLLDMEVLQSHRQKNPCADNDLVLQKQVYNQET